MTKEILTEENSIETKIGKLVFSSNKAFMWVKFHPAKYSWNGVAMNEADLSEMERKIKEAKKILAQQTQEIREPSGFLASLKQWIPVF